MTPLWLWGSKGISPLILNLGIRRRQVLKLHAQSTVSPNHKPYYILTRRPGGPQSWSGHTKKQKNVPSFLAIDP